MNASTFVRPAFVDRASLSRAALTAPPLGAAWDATEALLWTIMRTFEVQALAQYDASAPALATHDKRAVVGALQRLAPSDEPLAASELDAPMRALVGSAAAADGPEGRGAADRVLVVQGLVLERVREVVYGVIARSPGASEPTRRWAARGETASAAVARRAPELFAAGAGGGDAFARFVTASDDVLHKLDAVGEGVDRVFGQRFGFTFAEIVGDFVAALVPACTSLGMERRKVLSHLAAALMGI